MRVSKRIVAEQFVPTSTTPPSDVGIYRVNRKAIGVTGRIDMFDPETKVVSSVPQTVFQAGVPIVIFAGDGGSNGLSFSGTRGVFTLSAAVLTNFWNIVSAGGYAYFPANAGGLAAGLYWFKMTSDTAGEVFSETYTPGSGRPQFVASPTTLPNCTSGRITQVTSSITAYSFVLPGNMLGPNGRAQIVLMRAGDTSATSKTFVVAAGGQNIVSNPSSTSPVGESIFLLQNLGATNKQLVSRALGVGGYGGTVASHQYPTVDTSVDNTVAVTISVAANTASQLICGFSFSVYYAD